MNVFQEAVKIVVSALLQRILNRLKAKLLKKCAESCAFLKRQYSSNSE